MPRQKRLRTASHAGTWYSEDADALATQIQGWLNAVPSLPSVQPKAIIAPSRVFLLGPSHHVYAQACMLSKATSYLTPFGEIPIDAEIYSQLADTGEFDYMPMQVDEAEHSLELHLPYIAYIMRGRKFTLIPIMVGAVGWDGEDRYGEVLAPYLDDQESLFVISSDFCHWGSRFNYTLYDQTKGEIYEFIRWLDLMGVDSIAEGKPEVFREYMRQYSNTICGRHPIALLLQISMVSYSKMSLGFSLLYVSCALVGSYEPAERHAQYLHLVDRFMPRR